MGELILRLLDQPAFFRAAENLGDSRTAISGDIPRLPFTSSESVLRATPSAAAASVILRPKGSMHSRKTMPPGCGGFFMAPFISDSRHLRTEETEYSVPEVRKRVPQTASWQARLGSRINERASPPTPAQRNRWESPHPASWLMSEPRRSRPPLHSTVRVSRRDRKRSAVRGCRSRTEWNA